MATVYKTPGVYVEEIPKLPPSVAQVETAIPAFVGYTEKAEKNGASLTNVPTRISSLLEYVQYYGGDKTPNLINVKVDTANNNAVDSIAVTNTERYVLYDSLRVFFDNGGGDCYIVSVGKFGTAPAQGDEVLGTGLRAGVKVLEKYDEPTIILFPDAVNMVVSGSDDPGFYSLQQMVLEQCAKLQDRVGIFDIKENVLPTENPVANFRNKIGINNLKYAAAYYPWIYTTYPREVDFSTFKNSVTPKGGGPVIDLATLTSDSALNALVTSTSTAFDEIARVETVLTAIKKADASGTLNVSLTPSASIKDKFQELKKAVDIAPDSAAAKTAFSSLMNFSRLSLLKFQELKTQFATDNLKNDLNTYATSNSLWRGAATLFASIDKNTDALALTSIANNAGAINAVYPAIDATWLGQANAFAITASPKDYGNEADAANHPSIARQIALDVQSGFNLLSDFAETILSSSKNYKKSAQDTLYEKHPVISNIIKNIKKELSKIPPSGAIAGVYARVDNSRGVWKAPANESLNSVSGPTIQITADEQANLNVDAVAGNLLMPLELLQGKDIWYGEQGHLLEMITSGDM